MFHDLRKIKINFKHIFVNLAIAMVYYGRLRYRKSKSVKAILDEQANVGLRHPSQSLHFP